MTDFYPWQQSIWKKLFSSHIESDNFPHALLLSGVSGIGKKDLAFYLAKGLLCQSPKMDPQSGQSKPCEQCRACQLVSAGNHPDINHITIPEDKKIIPVESIREMIQWSVLSSQLNGKKVIIIEPAEVMNLSASNSLLKTLEEPVPDTILILVTHKKLALLPTIRSRCQRVDMPVPDHKMALQWLRGQQIEQASLMLSLASGAPLLVLKLAQGDQLEVRSLIIKYLLAIINDAIDPVQVAEDLNKQIKASKKKLLITAFDVIYWMDSIVTDLARLSQNCSELMICNIDYFQSLQQLSNRLYLKKLLQLSDSVNKAYYQIQGSINVNLLFEKLLIDWKNCKI